MTERQAQTHVVRLLTIAHTNPTGVDAYWDRYAFPDLEPEDLPSAFRGSSVVIGQLLAIIETLHLQPHLARGIDKMLAIYTRDAEEPPR